MTRLLRSLLPAVSLSAVLTVSAFSQMAPGMSMPGHDMSSHATPQGGMPAGLHQEWAVAMLDKSPRHREYLQIQAGSRTVTTLVVYPEIKTKAPVVVLIHEIFGESDWFKLMADEIASKGYIVLAPDLLSQTGPGGGGTDSFSGQDAVIKGISMLPPAQVISDLDAVADYGKKLPAANGKLAVAGFCWGGGKSFEFATQRPDLGAAFVFYGTPPSADKMAAIHAPVYGFYGGNDARVDATIPKAQEDMKAAGKMYEPVTYEGAGHGFMRGGQAPDARPDDVKAYDQGFARMQKLLKEMK